MSCSMTQHSDAGEALDNDNYTISPSLSYKHVCVYIGTKKARKNSRNFVKNEDDG